MEEGVELGRGAMAKRSTTWVPWGLRILRVWEGRRWMGVERRAGRVWGGMTTGFSGGMGLGERVRVGLLREIIVGNMNVVSKRREIEGLGGDFEQ